VVQPTFSTPIPRAQSRSTGFPAVKEDTGANLKVTTRSSWNCTGSCISYDLTLLLKFLCFFLLFILFLVKGQDFDSHTAALHARDRHNARIVWRATPREWCGAAASQRQDCPVCLGGRSYAVHPGHVHDGI
jgi:hypothetical protein